MVDGVLLPRFKRFVQLQDVLEHDGLGYRTPDQCLDALLSAAQRYHLSNQQVQGIGFHTQPILDRAYQISGKLSLVQLIATGTALDLGIGMLDTSLENDIYTGSSLMIQYTHSRKIARERYVLKTIGCEQLRNKISKHY